MGTGIKAGSQEAREPGSGNRIPAARFVLKNLLVWLVMVVMLIVVPDALESRLGLEIGRAVGWAVAFPVWIIGVERDWQARFGPLARVALQVPLWIAAALAAIWISDQARINWYR